MNRSQNFDDELRGWAELGDERLPARFLDAALAQVETTPQRGAGWWSLRDAIMQMQPAAALIGIAAVGVVALVVGLAIGGLSPHVTDQPSAAASPSASASEWASALREEPAGGAPDVPFTTDSEHNLAYIADGTAELGDQLPAWVDVSQLNWQLSSTTTDGVTMALGFEIGASPPEFEPGAATAYGVVLDTNRDGEADYVVGMDNVGGGAHREWILEVSSGRRSVNHTGRYGSGAYGTWTDTYFPGESRRRILAGRVESAGEDSLRFYFWASTDVDGEAVTDYAPDIGWITFRPTAD